MCCPYLLLPLSGFEARPAITTFTIPPHSLRAFTPTTPSSAQGSACLLGVQQCCWLWLVEHATSKIKLLPLAFVEQGTERVQAIGGDALPQLKTTAGWDGRDGTLPEEDEFDLADLMNEEL